MTRIAIIPITLFVAAGCHIGRSSRQLPYAMGPHGAAATLQCQRHVTVRGELLLVQDTAVLVLQQGRVVSVPYGLIRYGEFAATGLAILGRATPDATRSPTCSG